MKNSKFFFLIISLLLYFLPIIQFLNQVNLPQIASLDLYIIIFNQLILFFIIFLLSIFIYSFYFSKYLNFENFFLINSFIIYILFFFKNIKNLVYNKTNFIFDDILIFLIYFLIYICLIKLQKKIISFLIRFIFIFICLHSIYFSYNFYNIKINNDNYFFNSNKNKLTYFDTSSINSQNNSSVVFIILDGMMSLELAEKFNIIDSKIEQISLLKKKQLNYKDNFFSNYDTTYLSIASLLKGSYPAIETTKDYKTRDNFFPFMILNSSKDNEFFEILRRTKKEFYWYGNSWANCQPNIYIKCFNSSLFDKFIYISKSFYFNSLYFFIFNFFDKEIKNEISLNFLEKKESIIKNSINLVHVMNPHPPFFFDKNCNYNKNLDQRNGYENYSNAYNCLLNLTQNWVENLTKSDSDSLIFILGDHGWTFQDQIMKKNNLEKSYTRFRPFFSYRVPEKCNNLELPNSIVNVMRFAFKCMGSTDIEYLEDLKFDSFYENNKSFGKVILKAN